MFHESLGFRDFTEANRQHTTTRKVSSPAEGRRTAGCRSTVGRMNETNDAGSLLCLVSYQPVLFPTKENRESISHRPSAFRRAGGRRSSNLRDTFQRPPSPSMSRFVESGSGPESGKSRRIQRNQRHSNGDFPQVPCGSEGQLRSRLCVAKRIQTTGLWWPGQEREKRSWKSCPESRQRSRDHTP